MRAAAAFKVMKVLVLRKPTLPCDGGPQAAGSRLRPCPAPSAAQARDLPPSGKPWQPPPSQEPPTVPVGPSLALETRSAARARFDAQQAQKAGRAEVGAGAPELRPRQGTR